MSKTAPGVGGACYHRSWCQPSTAVTSKQQPAGTKPAGCVSQLTVSLSLHFAPIRPASVKVHSTEESGGSISEHLTILPMQIVAD